MAVFFALFFKRLSPAVCALGGASFSYYGLGFLKEKGYPWVTVVWVTAAFFLGGLGFLRGLAGLPPFLYADPLWRYRFRLLGLYGAALVLGFFLGLGARGSAAEDLRFGIPPGAVTGLIGVLDDDPRLVSGGRGMAGLELEAASGRGGLRCSARGRARVFFPKDSVPRIKSFGRGSRVFIEGALLPSEQGYGGGPLFRAASAHIMDAAPARERFRTGLRLLILERLSDPRWGGLAQALLLGTRDNLDTELAQAYRKAGCAHVLALSGMHLAVVSGAIAFLLRKPLGLKAAAGLGAAFILLYTILVGAQPSLERAAVMYLLGTLAVFGALPRNALSFLSLAFLIQLLIRPASGDSLSFILSYLALGGILGPGEALYDLIRGSVPDILARPLAASLGAFLATAAAVSASFGVLYPIGIPAGLLIIPLITVFMIAAMIYLALVLLIPPLAVPVGIALNFLYTVLNRLVFAAGQAPGLQTASPVTVLGIVLGLLALIAAVWSRRYMARSRLDPFDDGH